MPKSKRKTDLPPPKGAKPADVLDWAVRTGRILQRSRTAYASRFRAEPQRTDALLRMLAPGLTPAQAAEARRPMPSQVLASAGYEDVPPPGGSKPTLFAAGELPTVTASGISPTILNQVPWQARRAVARAASQADAHALIEAYTGPDGQTMAEVDSMPGGPLCSDVADYQAEVSAWASKP